jgi:hypothetical protein
MNQPDDAVMEREVIAKEDGRTLIYYRFIPKASAEPTDDTNTEAKPCLN